MDLCNRKIIRQLLRQHDIRPRKHWGQNFLVSRAALDRIVEAAAIQPGDTVLEIGGGAGTLTQALAVRAQRVIVYERDPKLCEVLRETLAPYANVELRCADARRIDASSLPSIPYTLVANLPYSVGTIILRRILESEQPPQKTVVMLQREVAERIVARPPQMNLLAVAMQTLVKPAVLFRVSQKAFWPEPGIESAVLHLHPLQCFGGQSPKTLTARTRIIQCAKRGFAHKRKRVLVNIARSPKEQRVLSERCTVPMNARAEELTMRQWKCLAE